MSVAGEQHAETRRTLATWLALFMPFTPIGQEGGLRRAPLAILALIVVNVAVHLVAMPIEQAGEARVNAQAGRLSKIELRIEERWLATGGGEGPNWAESSRLRGRNAFEKKFWEAFAAGRIVDEEHEIHVEWRAAVQDYEDAMSSLLHYRWGSHPENGNPLSAITAMFLHVGFWHLFGNMFILWVAGSVLEDVWGPRLLLLLYLGSGLLAEVPGAFFQDPDERWGVGASGAIAGLMGAFLVKMARQKLHFIILPMLPTVLLPGWVFFLPWGLTELRNATSGVNDGIGHWVHAGGFLAGILIALTYRWAGADALAREDLAQLDAHAARRKRETAEESARARHALGDSKGSLELLLQACRHDLGPHAAYAKALERLVLGGDRERAAQLALETLQALWEQGRKDEHAAAFAILSEHGLTDTLPSIDWLHGTDSTAVGRPRVAVESLHALLSARPEDPLAKAAMNRYADLLERLGHADAAAEARVRAAAIPTARDPSP